MLGMALQSGLMFTTKGAKSKDDEDKMKVNMIYLQVPVHFAYKADITPGTRVVLHGGPFLAYGVTGKTKIGNVSLDTFGKIEIEGEGLLEVKRFDAGLGIGAGIW